MSWADAWLNELRDRSGRWSRSGLENHGVSMRPVGRVGGQPGQAVTLHGSPIGSVRRQANGAFSAHIAGQARGYQSHARISTGHSSIAEAAAHVAAAHFDKIDKAPHEREDDLGVIQGARNPADVAAALPRDVVGKAARSEVAEAAAKGGQVRDEYGRLRHPVDIALSKLEQARSHLARAKTPGDVEQAREHLWAARRALPSGATGRGHVWNAIQARTPRGMRPHLIAAQKSLNPKYAREYDKPSLDEAAAKAHEQRQAQAAEAAKNEVAPIIPPRIAAMDRGAEHLGKSPDGKTTYWHVVHAPPGGMEQDRVYGHRNGEAFPATERHHQDMIPFQGKQRPVQAAQRAAAAQPKAKSAAKPAYPPEVGRLIAQWRQAKQRADNALGPRAAQSAHKAQLKAADLKAAGFVLKAGRWIEAPIKAVDQPKPNDRVAGLAADVKSGKRDAMDVIGQLIKEGEAAGKRDRQAREAARVAALGPAPQPDAEGFVKYDRKRHGDLRRGNTIKVKGIKGPRLVQKSQYQHKGLNKGQVVFHTDVSRGLQRGVADMQRHTLESGAITHVKVKGGGGRSPFEPTLPNHGGGPSPSTPESRGHGGAAAVANRAMHHEAFAALSQDQRTAVRNYMGGLASGPGSAGEVNDALRRGKEHAVTELIDPAVASHQAGPGGITLWRGRDYYFGLEHRPDFKVGQIIRDRAYTSASSSRKVGIQFASAGNKRARGGHLFKIELPAGHPMLPTPPVHPGKRVGMYHDEREVLLPRGMKLKVTKVTRPDKNNVVTVHVQPT